MIIRDLITQLAALDPNGTVEGVEHLKLSVSLLNTKAIPQRLKKPKKFLKGLERIACAKAQGEPAMVAAAYGVSTATVWALRRELQEGKIG